MTVWVSPSESLATRLNISSVPLPVSEGTAATLQGGRIEPAAIALDIDSWLAAGERAPSATKVLGRYVATLAYVGAVELLDRGRAELAVRLLEVGIRHAPDDPSLRANLGVALWESGRRYDATVQLVIATHQFARVGQVAPALWLLTARVLSEAGRHQDALELLETLAATNPRQPLFWDLIDSIEARQDVGAG